MSRLLIDPSMPEGPKFDGIPSAAGWLHVCALSYAARALTDGFVPAGRVHKLTNDPPRAVDQAVRWLTSPRPGCRNPLWDVAEGGWQIHDYDDPEYGNPTREDTSNARRQKVEAGRIGGQRSVESRRERFGTAQPQHPPYSEPEAKPEASASNRPEATGEAPSKPPSPHLPSPHLPSPHLPSEIREVFDAWLSSLPEGTRREFTPQRRSAIKGALARAPLADCLDAVKGWRWDTWENRAQNNDLDDCLRPSNLERFRDWERGINRPGQLNGQVRKEHPTDARVRELQQRAAHLALQEASE